MADFAEIGEIISRCMGYKDNEFINAYYKNINTLTHLGYSITSSSLCDAQIHGG